MSLNGCVHKWWQKEEGQQHLINQVLWKKLFLCWKIITVDQRYYLPFSLLNRKKHFVIKMLYFPSLSAMRYKIKYKPNKLSKWFKNALNDYIQFLFDISCDYKYFWIINYMFLLGVVLIFKQNNFLLQTFRSINSHKLQIYSIS